MPRGLCATAARATGARFILARERKSTRGGRDYLERLKQDLLEVLQKYEKIDLQNVSMKFDQNGDCDVL